MLINAYLVDKGKDLLPRSHWYLYLFQVFLCEHWKVNPIDFMFAYENVKDNHTSLLELGE